MITYDLERAKQAVQFLAASPYFAKHVTKLRTTLRRPRALPFKGDTEFLNELVNIGRQSPSAFENLVHVAEVKRDDRNDYQRRFMAEKRRRDRKVIELEQLMTGAEVPFEDRLTLLQRQYAVWNAEKAKLVERNAQRSWADRNELVREFWAEKESELDELIAEAKREPQLKRKLNNMLRQRPHTAVGEALAKAAQYQQTPPVRRVHAVNTSR